MTAANAAAPRIGSFIPRPFVSSGTAYPAISSPALSGALHSQKTISRYVQMIGDPARRRQALKRDEFQGGAPHANPTVDAVAPRCGEGRRLGSCCRRDRAEARLRRREGGRRRDQEALRRQADGLRQDQARRARDRRERPGRADQCRDREPDDGGRLRQGRARLRRRQPAAGRRQLPVHPGLRKGLGRDAHAARTDAGHHLRRRDVERRAAYGQGQHQGHDRRLRRLTPGIIVTDQNKARKHHDHQAHAARARSGQGHSR
ncbi:hypothetical protein BOS5A_210703 [Bosea sp. EC-HK365B]|nr:hypothetical protein BOSE7B_120565 [Bosea sp. 7B]CAD5276147.1 hypothetical protein BOSE21B_30346 [Bosea sp. 21B]VVT59912.1 hypothetical protein BOS5A_210703 [Bosea sp. EC-HK365B]VXC09873.1 hypothetical protein BOSE127_170203 [Bosea sp. 127]